MTENNSLRNNDFEQYKRTHPDVKELATVWRGSDEDQAWRATYLSQETDIIQYIENEQVVTFFRALSDLEKQNKEAAIVADEKPPTSFFEDLGVIHEHSDDKQFHKVTWVRLANKRKARVGDRWAEVEYVLVDQSSEHVVLDSGADFWHSETVVVVSDEEKVDYNQEHGANPLYLAPGIIEPWQALWALGEIAVQDKE